MAPLLAQTLPAFQNGRPAPERALPGIAPAANGRAPLRNSVCVQPGHAAKLASALASPEAPLRRSVQDASSPSPAKPTPFEPKRSFMRRKSSADSVEDRAALSLRSGGSSPSGRDAPRSLVGQALDALVQQRQPGRGLRPRTPHRERVAGGRGHAGVGGAGVGQAALRLLRRAAGHGAFHGAQRPPATARPPRVAVCHPPRRSAGRVDRRIDDRPRP